jgi:hypothetical protein
MGFILDQEDMKELNTDDKIVLGGRWGRTKRN